MRTILIYNGEGTKPSSIKAVASSLQKEKFDQKYSIHTIGSAAISHQSWQNDAALLIFPGGRDIPYHLALQGVPNNLIRSFVRQGGSYLGICAGGYYGCAFLEFEKGGPLEIIQTRELAFFPGIARGPAYGNGQFCYETERGAREAFLSLESGMHATAYYNGGCAFVDAHNYPDTSVIARYADIAGTPAAIIQCNVGKGRAILSGVHPEYSASSLFKDLLMLAGI